MLGIFDSGVGGLSIFIEIKKLLPNENIFYVADSISFPYGNLSPQKIKERTFKITKFLIKEKVCLIVVACNTATTVSLSFLREKFNLPIVGVVPVVKTAAFLTKRKKIAILATKPTLESKYHKNLINEFCQGVEVINQNCPGLVELIEEGQIKGKRIEMLLKKYINPLISKKQIDVFALGCTHFPFLRSKIKNIINDETFILDSGPAVARQVKRVLINERLLDKTKKPKYIFYTTGNKDKFEKVARQLLEDKDLKARKIDL